MKFYYVATADAMVSVVIQTKGLRILVDVVAVPTMFDPASLDVVLVSSLR